MKKFFISLLIGIGVALLGWVVAAFIGGNLFSGLPYDTAFICGWAMYLCIVIVICTGAILSKIKTDR